MDGLPDIVLPHHRAVVLVTAASGTSTPAAATASCRARGAATCAPEARAQRGARRGVAAALTAPGWRALVVWGCELKDGEAASGRLRGFLRR